jgi:hypothetical protein
MINPDTLEDFHAWLMVTPGIEPRLAAQALELVQDYITITYKGDKNNG